EQLIISNGSWWPPLKTYRLTEKGWALADATFWKLACVWCRGTKYTETGVLCRSCEGSGLARGTSSCAHKSPACDECVAHDTLCAMSS
ncbi:MAG: hypothetical protein OK454_06545, partial [Thaumarchaeota archaeon]|nr:hypothetical protein [Nitrososphaerota archaeon]